MKVHKSVTTARVARALERAARTMENPGFCTACGKEAEGCDPDARNDRCYSCGEKAVYGAEEALLMLFDGGLA